MPHEGGHDFRRPALDACLVVPDGRVETRRHEPGPYLQSLRLWLSYLTRIDQQWDSADFETLAAFKEWRTTDSRNSRRAREGSWAADKAALTHFYV